MDKGPLIDIVILNFNREADTRECLLSVKRSNYENYRLILVDNGSSDGSGLRLKTQFEEAIFLRSDKNLGFAGGCNLGIRHSLQTGLAGYILLLNNDTVVSENLLEALLEAAEMDVLAGIVGAVNYYYLWPEKIHMVGHRFIWWLGVQRRLLDIDVGSREVESVSGCCMLIKREVIEKVGLFDERFFVYYEDADICLRAKKANFKVIAVKKAKVWHKINGILGTRTPCEYYIYARNQPLFMLKNCPRIFLTDFFIVYFLKVFVRMGYFFATFRGDISGAILRGVADFFKGNFGAGRLFK